MGLYFLHHFHKVYLSKTEHEKQAQYSLRYRIYSDELKKKNINTSDHEIKMIRDPEDTLKNTMLLYVGKKNNPKASCRITLYEQGTLPVTIKERYSLNCFPEFENNKIAEISRLVIDPKYRKGVIIFSIVTKLYHICGQNNVDFCLLYCSPGLSNLYKRFGFRTYQAHTLRTHDGLRIPMINILNMKNLH